MKYCTELPVELLFYPVPHPDKSRGAFKPVLEAWPKIRGEICFDVH